MPACATSVCTPNRIVPQPDWQAGLESGWISHRSRWPGGREIGASRLRSQDRFQHTDKNPEVRIVTIAGRTFALMSDLVDCLDRRFPVKDCYQIRKMHEIARHLCLGADKQILLGMLRKPDSKSRVSEPAMALRHGDPSSWHPMDLAPNQDNAKPEF